MIQLRNQKKAWEESVFLIKKSHNGSLPFIVPYRVFSMRRVEPFMIGFVQQNLITSARYLPNSSLSTVAAVDKSSTTQSSTSLKPEQTHSTNQSTHVSGTHTTNNTSSTEHMHSDNTKQQKTSSSSSSTPEPIVPTITNNNNWIEHLEPDLECPICLQSILTSDRLIRGDCNCRRVKPMHTNFLIRAMELAIQQLKILHRRYLPTI